MRLFEAVNQTNNYDLRDMSTTINTTNIYNPIIVLDKETALQIARELPPPPAMEPHAEPKQVAAEDDTAPPTPC